MKTVHIRCFRYDPDHDEAPYFQTYEVPWEDDMRVLDCLQYVREQLDPTLAFFVNCKRGTCGRCTMRINGKVKMACMTPVEGDVTVEPVNHQKVIRDLWTELT